MNANALPPFTEEDIADYLINTPDFFERHAALLASVQLTSPHGQRAVSLQERQAEMLREKIRHLELKAANMIRFGQENTVTATRLHDWTLTLLQTADANTLPQVLVQSVRERFAVPQVALRVWGVQPEFVGAPHVCPPDEAVQDFARALDKPLCGPNTGVLVVQWLDDPSAVASVAVVALREPQGGAVFGVLVMGSDDPQRFGVDMGTDFLGHLSALASAALQRLREPPQA
ncbi:MAG: hypothetical protein RL297_222 [Pseudomonadota bacterium]|jgi:uncharacterized protein YigA (DUF484 family)